jgi:hypothetical protein
MDDELPGYLLHQRIGVGAASEVYRAEPVGSPGRPVAVKRLRIDAPPRAVDELRREAMVLARLSHPSLMRILDIVPDGDGVALVLPLAAGGSLAARLATADGGLEPAEAADLGARLASALAAAHDAGLVHRDVKPGNILFDAEGQPLLGDFGTARLLSERAPVRRDGGVPRPGCRTRRRARCSDRRVRPRRDALRDARGRPSVRGLDPPPDPRGSRPEHPRPAGRGVGGSGSARRHHRTRDGARPERPVPDRQRARRPAGRVPQATPDRWGDARGPSAAVDRAGRGARRGPATAAEARADGDRPSAPRHRSAVGAAGPPRDRLVAGARRRARPHPRRPQGQWRGGRRTPGRRPAARRRPRDRLPRLRTRRCHRATTPATLPPPTPHASCTRTSRVAGARSPSLGTAVS